MGILTSIFTWWNGPGLGTRVMTRRSGSEVGRDAEGNIYYRSGSGAAQRRWVIYNGGEPEATRIPPEWHGWMHKTALLPPTEAPVLPRIWERAWTPSATGTASAYLPGGSLDSGAVRARATGDYRAWSPGATAATRAPAHPAAEG